MTAGSSRGPGSDAGSVAEIRAALAECRPCVFEEFGRSMIGEEELHQIELEKRLRDCGE